MLALLLRIDYEIQRHLHQQKIGQNSGFK